jgi:hypothetical protein
MTQPLQTVFVWRGFSRPEVENNLLPASLRFKPVGISRSRTKEQEISSPLILQRVMTINRAAKRNCCGRIITSIGSQLRCFPVRASENARGAQRKLLAEVILKVRPVAATLRRAKIPYFRIYDLRSTYATRLSAGGVADEWVTQLLRQGDAKVFKKYSQMKLQMKREALIKLNRQANEAHMGSDTARVN